MTPRHPMASLDRLAHLASYPTNRGAFYQFALTHFATDEVLDQVLDLPNDTFASPAQLIASAGDGQWWRR